MFVMVGTPVFRSCNQTSCENEVICTVFNMQVALDLQINFINSASMIDGPSPYRMEVHKQEAGDQFARNILTCLDDQPCRSEDGYTYSGMAPNNLSLLITIIDSEYGGTYTARGFVRRPSGTDLSLTKAFTSKQSNK